MKLAAVIAALVVLATADLQAGAFSMPIEHWAAQMIEDLGFRNGELRRNDYRARSDSYLSYQEDYYRGMHQHWLALEETHPEMAAKALESFSGMVDKAVQYVRSTEDGIFRSLDPDGDGIVTTTEAEVVLRHLGHLADLDGDGRLDRGEALLAEAALAGGEDLSQMRTRDRLVRNLSLGSGFLN